MDFSEPLRGWRAVQAPGRRPAAARCVLQLAGAAMQRPVSHQVKGQSAMTALRGAARLRAISNPFFTTWPALVAIFAAFTLGAIVRRESPPIAAQIWQVLATSFQEGVLYVVAQYNIQHATSIGRGSARTDGVGR